MLDLVRKLGGIGVLHTVDLVCMPDTFREQGVLAGRFRGKGALAASEYQLIGTDTDGVTVLQELALDPSTANEGAIGAVQVLYDTVILLVGNGSVSPADLGVRQPDVALGIAPDKGLAVGQLVRRFVPPEAGDYDLLQWQQNPLSGS